MTVKVRDFLSEEASRRTLIPSGAAAIAAFEYGNPDGFPLLLIHGWSLSHLCWYKQLTNKRLLKNCKIIAIDLRGHGDSSIGGAESVSSAMQADDVRVVLEHYGVRGVLVVGWSLGGVVLCDYLRRYGCEHMAGAIFVGSPVDINPDSKFNDAGPSLAAALKGMTGIDPQTDLVEEPLSTDNVLATSSFIHACVRNRLNQEELEVLLAFSMIVSPAARRAILGRGADENTATMLSALARAKGQGLKASVMYGGVDQICNPRGSERLAATLGTEPERYAEAGHALMIDQPERFASDVLRMISLIRTEAVE